MKKEETEQLQNAVKVLISFIFPAALKTYESGDDFVDRPQGLGVDSHVDYWQRYLTLSDVEDYDSDQLALQTISAWKEGHSNDLLVRLLDSGRAAQIESFVGQFATEELCILLTGVTAALRNESAETWEGGLHAPGISSVWRMMRNRRPPGVLLADTVSQIMQDLVPLHLPLALDVYKHFAHDKQSELPNLIDEKQQTKLQNTLRQALINSYGTGSGENLLNALHDGSPEILWCICQQVLTENVDGLPFDGWNGISDAIVEAAEKNPSVGVIITVPFFTTRKDVIKHCPTEGTGVTQPVREYVVEVNLELARLLFDFNKLAPLLINTEPPQHIDSRLRAQYEAAQTKASEYLES